MKLLNRSNDDVIFIRNSKIVGITILNIIQKKKIEITKNLNDKISQLLVHQLFE